MFVLEDLTGIRSATEKVQVKNRYIGAMNLHRKGIEHIGVVTAGV